MSGAGPAGPIASGGAEPTHWYTPTSKKITVALITLAGVGAILLGCSLGGVMSAESTELWKVVGSIGLGVGGLGTIIMVQYRRDFKEVEEAGKFLEWAREKTKAGLWIILPIVASVGLASLTVGLGFGMSFPEHSTLIWTTTILGSALIGTAFMRTWLRKLSQEEAVAAHDQAAAAVSTAQANSRDWLEKLIPDKAAAAAIDYIASQAPVLTTKTGISKMFPPDAKGIPKFDPAAMRTELTRKPVGPEEKPVVDAATATKLVRAFSVWSINYKNTQDPSPQVSTGDIADATMRAFITIPSGDDDFDWGNQFAYLVSEKLGRKYPASVAREVTGRLTHPKIPTWAPDPETFGDVNSARAGKKKMEGAIAQDEVAGEPPDAASQDHLRAVNNFLSGMAVQTAHHTAKEKQLIAEVARDLAYVEGSPEEWKNRFFQELGFRLPNIYDTPTSLTDLQRELTDMGMAGKWEPISADVIAAAKAARDYTAEKRIAMPVTYNKLSDVQLFRAQYAEELKQHGLRAELIEASLRRFDIEILTDIVNREAPGTAEFLRTKVTGVGLNKDVNAEFTAAGLVRSEVAKTLGELSEEYLLARPPHGRTWMEWIVNHIAPVGSPLDNLTK